MPIFVRAGDNSRTYTVRADEKYDIDLNNSFKDGDTSADIEAGQRAGWQSILVLTGYEQSTFQEGSLSQFEKCSDICAAIDFILSWTIFSPE